MTTNNDKKNKWPLILTVIIIILGGFGIAGSTYLKSDKGVINNLPTFEVQQGPLKLSVTETGTIQAREQIVVKNEVEGKTSIISLIKEGSSVKKGDLLIELDASSLVDKKLDLEIAVKNAEASFISARENLEVVKNQTQSNVDKAELAYEFAVQDLEKYLQGEYPNELKQAESKITLAREEVTRSEDELEWSQKLYDENYISRTELEADELALKQKTLNLELAQNNLNLLKDYTHKRQLAQLESDVEQTRMSLERTALKAGAEIVQAEADLKARESGYARQQDKLKKNKAQIEKTRIHAPTDGIVIYATSAESGKGRGSTTEPLDEGALIQERQDLIYLPTTSGVNAEIGINEANLDKIKVGLPVLVTVDALPGKSYTGYIASIAPMPDAQSMFLNSDLKIYDTTVYLNDNEFTDQLRTGMSCIAEIIAEQHEIATYVPVQAILRVGGNPTAYVVTENTVEPRTVETGLDNNRMIRIVSGLDQGEFVSLAPPLAEAEADSSSYENLIDVPAETTVETSGSPGTVQGQRPGGKGSPPGASGEELSDEERQKRKVRFENATPEEKEEMIQKRQAAQAEGEGNA